MGIMSLIDFIIVEKVKSLPEIDTAINLTLYKTEFPEITLYNIESIKKCHLTIGL